MVRKCPRERYLNRNLPHGETKTDVLRDILKKVILSINPGTTTTSFVETQVNTEFASRDNLQMISFEAESEAKRMTALVTRWLIYATQENYTILANDVSDSVSFAGKTETVRAHQILEFPDRIEVVRYKYKAPNLSYRGRTLDSRPEGSEALLLLEKLGEKKTSSPKPIYGAIYFMKSKDDVAGVLAPGFESQKGKNIVRYHFTKEEAETVEKAYISPDVASQCPIEECGDCKYYDLCHLRFEKRTLMEPQPIKVAGIDDIVLTKPQQQFVNFRNGECRVNAVAGSGKTTVVALRTASILEEGDDPQSILMLTFSEKAKGEMRTRLKEFAVGNILKDERLPVEKVNIETFNSWGQKLLDENFKLLGFSAAPTVIDDIQRKDIVIALLSSRPRTLPLDYNNPFLDMPNASGAVIAVCKYLEKMKAAHIASVNDVPKTLGAVTAPYAQDYFDIYNAYNQTLTARNLVDYEDQLRLLLELANHGIFEKLPYKHIVVDEFQDSDPNQIEIILELKRRNKNVKSLAVVGDELQAIYGFRNATPDNLVDFGKFFPGMIDIDMSANFRSQAPIIQMANKIIEKTSRLGKMIEAHKQTSHVKPAVFQIDDEERERTLFVRQVAKLLRDGTAPKDIAILCRTKAELVKMQSALSEAGILSILKVPEVIAEAPFVKAIISLALFLRNPVDKASLSLYVKSMDQDPFNEKDVNDASDAILSVFEACKSETDKVSTFLALIERDSEDYVAASFVETLKRQNFQSLTQYLDYCIKYHDYGVRDTKSTVQERTDCVTLITVHSAKGLEWETVLLSLRRFPTDMESQRLFYVGITRAKERLLLTYTSKQQLLADMLVA